MYFLCDSVGGLLAFQALCHDAQNDEFSCGSFEEDADNISLDSSLNFNFTLSGVFTFGSPIGLVSLNKKLSLDKGACIFYGSIVCIYCMFYDKNIKLKVNETARKL